MTASSGTRPPGLPPSSATIPRTDSADRDRRLEGYGARLDESFERAADVAGLVRHDLEIANMTVRLELAGAALDPVLLRALAHRANATSGAPAVDLTIRAWDAASTGVRCPAPDTELTDLHAGFLPELSSDRFHSALDPHSGAFSFFDRSGALGVWTCPDADRAEPYECAAPMRSILQAALQARGLQLAHGAVVGTERGGALILGRGGSGKSNTALACLGAGMHYVGDDYVILKASRKRAHNVFQTGKLFPEDLDLHPGLRPARATASRNHAGKWVFFFAESGHDENATGLRDAFVSNLDVRVALIAEIGSGSRTTVRPARKAEALLALAPNTLIQLPGGGATDLRQLAGFLAHVPTCVIELGPDREEVAQAVARTIEEHAR